jgi:hypothetical protein
VAETRGQFGNPEEGKPLPMEAVARRVIEAKLTGKTKCML